MAQPSNPGHRRDASTASTDALMETELQNIAAGANTPPRVLSSRRNIVSEPTTAYGRFIKNLDDKVENSAIGRYFKLKERGSTFSTECMGGFAAFLTLAYVCPVTAAMIADTGATCPLDAPDDIYYSCKTRIKQQLMTSAALASLISTFLMGVVANLPFMLAPGMGTTAYFAYTIVGARGSGTVPYTTANAAVFMEGIAFLLLSVSGLRKAAVSALPKCIAYGMGAGMGLFLALIGMEGGEGIGLITLSPNTLVKLGACPPEHRHHIEHGEAYECTGGVMTSATSWLGMMGVISIAVSVQRGWNAGLGITILIISAMSWFRGTTFTTFPDTPIGNQKFEYFKQVVSIEGISDIACKFEFSTFGHPAVWIALITLLYTDILDATGCMFAMARQAGMVNETGGFEGDYTAFLVDALSCSIAGLLGVSPLTVFLESSVGVELGARTGLAAIVGSMGFLLTIIFNPILSNIPPWATGPALIFVGALQMEHFMNVDWHDKNQAVPAFITAVMMPFTFSVAYGILFGVGAFVMMFCLNRFFDFLAGPGTIKERFAIMTRKEKSADDVEGGHFEGKKEVEMIQ